ncbi:hypothetical protein D3C81_1358740 [compost metagenome]
MAGIAQQRDRAGRPLRQRVAHVQRGNQHLVAGIEQCARLWMEAGIRAAQVFHAARRGPRLVPPCFLCHRGKDKDVAAAVEREGDDLCGGIRAPPLGEGVQVRYAGQLFGGHHSAVCHHAGEDRAFLAEQGGAHRGVDAVGADQHVDTLFRAVGKAQRGAGGVRDDCHRLVIQAHVRCGHRGLQRGHQVGPVHGELRGTVAALGVLLHRQARGFFTGIPDTADAVGGTRGGLAQRVADAQAVQRAHRVGREVDVRADAGKALRLFVNHRVQAELAQRDGRGQSADAGAVDADLQSHVAVPVTPARRSGTGGARADLLCS